MRLDMFIIDGKRFASLATYFLKQSSSKREPALRRCYDRICEYCDGEDYTEEDEIYQKRELLGKYLEDTRSFPSEEELRRMYKDIRKIPGVRFIATNKPPGDDPDGAEIIVVVQVMYLAVDGVVYDLGWWKIVIRWPSYPGLNMSLADFSYWSDKLEDPLSQDGKSIFFGDNCNSVFYARALATRNGYHPYFNRNGGEFCFGPTNDIAIARDLLAGNFTNAITTAVYALHGEREISHGNIETLVAERAYIADPSDIRKKELRKLFPERNVKE